MAGIGAASVLFSTIIFTYGTVHTDSAVVPSVPRA